MNKALNTREIEIRMKRIEKKWCACVKCIRKDYETEKFARDMRFEIHG